MLWQLTLPPFISFFLMKGGSAGVSKFNKKIESNIFGVQKFRRFYYKSVNKQGKLKNLVGANIFDTNIKSNLITR